MSSENYYQRKLPRGRQEQIFNFTLRLAALFDPRNINFWRQAAREASHQQANLFWKPMYLVQLVERASEKNEYGGGPQNHLPELI